VRLEKEQETTLFSAMPVSKRALALALIFPGHNLEDFNAAGDSIFIRDYARQFR